MGSIQLGPTLIWWIWAFSLCISVGLHKFSTRITRGKLYAKEVVRVTRELACVFLLLGICCKVKDLNLDCKCLTWFKYSSILKSLASNSPFTWLTTNLESENTSTVLPPIFWTIAIPTNKALYSASLFVAEKINLKDFLIIIFSGDTTTSPIPDLLWLAPPSTYTLQDRGYWKEIIPTDFPSMFCFSPSSSSGDSANSDTKFARTWPLIEVRGIYLISKAPKIVPHLAILPM